VQDSAVTFECSSTANELLLWFNSTCVITQQSISRCQSDYISRDNSRRTTVPQRFSVTSGNNDTHVTRDLNINPTQLTDAGVYLCAERRYAQTGPVVDDSSSAQLIVLGDFILDF